MSPTRHVLVIERRPTPHDPPKHAGVLARVVRSFSDGLRELQSAGYDAVFLRVDGADELSLVLRIKSAAPEVPVCALIPDLNKDLERLARESGADEVLPTARGPGRGSTALSRALATSEDLIQRSRALVARSVALREQSWELRAASRALKSSVFDLARIPLRDFVPLLIEDDADHAFFLKRSFERNALPFPLPVLRNGEEAISYLAGKGKFSDRVQHPLPTLLIADLHLPRKDGFEVLRWVRSKPVFEKLVTFILSSSPLRKDFETAFGAGADFFYIKPLDLEALDDLTRVMAVRWSRIYQARQRPESSRGTPQGS